ncbi:MAG TPA: F0F1 ATP synthase subunit A [Candidatus Saccharimonadales bacterium]|nr:F0F1 ATP synthase subunit A [Candidatus Saccharimonadales bacterium]
MLSFFAAEGSGVPLAAEPVFHVGPLAVTNSMLFGIITAVAVILILAAAAKRTAARPKSKFAFAVESLIDMIWGAITENFAGDRERARKHLPLVITLFTFILVNNLSGLLPGMGSITIQNGAEISPLLRPFTTDLNGTLALAVLTIGLVQFYVIRELGILGHLKHYFTNKPWNPMNLFIGLIEVLGEFIRIVTLSMRLFGVIYAGEVLLHVIGDLAGNFGWAATIPVYFLEIFFSAIQAYIFIMLTTAYLGMATAHSDDHSEDHSAAPDIREVAGGARSK